MCMLECLVVKDGYTKLDASCAMACVNVAPGLYAELLHFLILCVCVSVCVCVAQAVIGIN